MEKYLSSLLREKWCLLVWTGAFHWIHCGPRDKDITLEGTDGPLSAQINQTQLTPSALSSKSHCLQWHLLLGAQLYNLVSPTRLSKAAICSTELGTTEHSCHYAGLTTVRRARPLAPWRVSDSVTQDLLRGQQSSPLGIPHAPRTKRYVLAVILRKSLGRKHSLLRTHTSFRITAKVKYLLTILFDTWLNYPGKNGILLQ